MNHISSLGAALVGVALLSLTACSVDEKRQLYRDSGPIASLQVPAGLSEPVHEKALPLPQVDKSTLGDEPFDTHPPVNLPVAEEAAEQAEP